MEPPNPSFANELNVLQQVTVLVFDVLRVGVSIPFQVHRLEVLIKTGLVAFSDTFFEFADVGPEEAQHSSLANFLQVLASLFYSISKKVAVRACPKALSRLLSLLPCCVHISLHARVRTPTLWSARALRARCNFCRNGKHKVSHASSDVTDAGTIGDG